MVNSALRGICGLSASWWGNGLPRRRRLGDVRAWPPTMGLRHGPYSYGRQQWGILHNGGNPDAAMPRGRRRPSGCKVLFYGKSKGRYHRNKSRLTTCQQPR